MSTTNITIYLKRPEDKGFEPVRIANTLENLQQLVGGYIETLTLPGNVVAIFRKVKRSATSESDCSQSPSVASTGLAPGMAEYEEGRLHGLPYNFSVHGIGLVGPVIIAGTDGDEFANAPFPTASAVKHYFYQMHRCRYAWRRH